jgi:hypothetical protein
MIDHGFIRYIVRDARRTSSVTRIGFITRYQHLEVKNNDILIDTCRKKNSKNDKGQGQGHRHVKSLV